jgi:predicted secreted protein
LASARSLSLDPAVPSAASARLAEIDARIAGHLQSLLQLEREPGDDAWRRVLHENLAALNAERRALLGD